MTLEKELEIYFGYASFKEGQKEIVEGVLTQDKVLGILPTGSGKTLSYSLPTFMKGWKTLVISPLIALMEDQMNRLNQVKKHTAVLLNSTQTAFERQYLLQHLNHFSIIILSPEMLQNKGVFPYLKAMNFRLAVVDEAHCISQWGFDFRPEYLKIPTMLKKLMIPKWLGLTATASTFVKEDIKKFLFLNEKVFTVHYPVNRNNIGYLICSLPDEKSRIEHLLNVLKNRGESGIIYCNTRKKTQQLAEILKSSGISCGFYHGGLSSMQRKILQQQFKENQLQIMVATNAFGMGIDKKDIRFVIHYQLPASIEDYVQETGRCCRDGEEGFALLYYVPKDERIHRHFNQVRQEQAPQLKEQLKDILPSETYFDEKIKEKNRQPDAMQQLIKENHCIRQAIATYFGDTLPVRPEKCCSFHELTLKDYPSQKFSENNLEKSAFNWEDKLNSLFFHK